MTDLMQKGLKLLKFSTTDGPWKIGCLIPTPEQLDHATEIVEKARIDLKGKLVIDYVIPDYYAKHPKIAWEAGEDVFLI